MKIKIILLLILSTVLLVSCNKVQETSIEVVASSIPKEIYVDEEIDLSKIQIQVNFKDESTTTIDLSKEMLSDEDHSKLLTVGTHKITVNYKDLKTEVSITVKERIYKIEFYDHSGIIVKIEYVKKGSSATAPMLAEVKGKTFIKWDVDFNNVTQDLKVNPVYEEEKNYLYYELGNDDYGDFIVIGLSGDIKIAAFDIDLILNTSRITIFEVMNYNHVMFNKDIDGKVSFNYASSDNLVEDTILLKIYYFGEVKKGYIFAVIKGAKFITDDYKIEDAVIFLDELLGTVGV